MNMLSMAGRMLALEATQKEADFFIHYLLEYKLFGQTFYLTTTHISMIIVSVVLIVFSICARKKMQHPDEVPGVFQNIIELIVEMLDNMVNGIMGPNATRFVNYLSMVFIFILVSNISGLFGLRAPTADYGVTLPLGLITFALIHYNGVKKNKVKHFTNLFQPVALLFPINVIGEFAVPLSLSLRLFGNVLSGTVMMGLLYGITPIFTRFGIPAAAHVYFDLFSGAIQTYVFCMLTMVYVNDKIAD